MLSCVGSIATISFPITFIFNNSAAFFYPKSVLNGNKIIGSYKIGQYGSVGCEAAADLQCVIVFKTVLIVKMF
jgi:hypothetical protein